MRKKLKFSNIYMAVVLLITYVPIFFVVLFSFNSSRLTVNFEGFTWHWYERLLTDYDLIEALKNSLVLGVLSCIVSAVIGTIGAIGMARIHHRGKAGIEYLSMMPLMIPEIILGMVFLAFFSILGLPFGMTTLVLGHTAFCVPYIFMMVKSRLVGIDRSLEEAARDLGASQRRAFFDIILPLIMPAVLSGMILAFAMSFDDVVISIFLTGPTLSTLPIRIYTQLKTGGTPEINALCTIILIVIVVVLMLRELISSRRRA